MRRREADTKTENLIVLKQPSNTAELSQFILGEWYNPITCISQYSQITNPDSHILIRGGVLWIDGFRSSNDGNG